MRPTLGRAHAQGLSEHRFATAVEVVRHLGQSQLFDMALWALGRRVPALTLAEARRSFDAGDFVRLHVLRPTWHFLDPGDLGLFLALSADRVRAASRSTDVRIGLDEAAIGRAVDSVLAALAGGAAMTRAELGEALAAAGRPHAGQTLAHVMMHAELTGRVASGPLRGAQHTYRLIDAPARAWTTEEALAEGARRYARGHGPIRDRDYAWWASLTLASARRGIALAGLRPVDIEGEQHWAFDEPVAADPPEVMLLPNFDEYISYARDPRDYAGFGAPASAALRGTGLLMVAGRLGGSWTRTVAGGEVSVAVRPGVRLDSRRLRLLESEAAAFGAFLGLPATVSVAA